ncbi:glutamate receptor ionotropic, NMDA 1-like [Chironomus tepperi]|uniref:glutamate receptor ionotropic, NMDA 1-like n=1 Tax=Chironomus tepperi TaxID=113505 RepID=UPI00391FA0ED
MALKTFIIYIVLISLVSTIEINELELDENHKNLIDAFTIIRNNLIQSHSAIGFNLISVNDPKGNYEVVNQEIIKNAYKMESIRISNTRSTFPTIVRYSLILIDSIKSFRDSLSTSEQQIDFKKFDNAKLHMIILLDGNLADVHEIFNFFYSKSILNVLALINDNGTLLLNFEPFADPTRCNDTTPKVINKFENGKFKEKLYLFHKISNLNLCPIKVTTFTKSVAVFKETLPDGSFTFHGYEMKLVQNVAKMLNFTLNVLFRDGPQQWGVIYDNGTFTRAMADLKDRKTEILFGSLYIRESRAKYFDSSIPYLNYPVLLALSPQTKLNMFEKLLLPFKATLWILLLLTFSFGIVVILVINLRFKFLRNFVYGVGVKDPIMNLFLVINGLSQTKLPKRNFARFILMMVSILCLIIRSLYQGSIYKFLQSDGRHKEPQTIQELIDNEYVFILSESNLDILKHFKSSVKYKTKPLDGAKDSDLDSYILGTEKTAAFTSKFELLIYSLKHDKFPYKICKEYYFTVNIVLYYNQNFYLKAAIDEAIQKILQHGFMEHWIKEFDKTEKWKVNNKEPELMTLEHLSGVFSLLLIGHFLSVFVFGTEFLMRKFVH